MIPCRFLGKELPLCSHVLEYLQDGLSRLVRQVFYGSPLPLLSHKVVILLLSSALFFVALQKVVRHFSIILQTATGNFRNGAYKILNQAQKMEHFIHEKGEFLSVFVSATCHLSLAFKGII